MIIAVDIDVDALGDVLHLIRNGIEQERRRPKFGGGALKSARRVARLRRVESAVVAAQRQSTALAEMP